MKNKAIKQGLNRTRLIPYMFVAPAVLYIIAVTMIPAVMALPISFTNWSALSPNKQFVGFENYIRLISDKAYWESCLVMAKFFFYVPIVMATGLGAALLLNQQQKGTQLFRVIFYAPVITSTVAVAILFDWFYQPTFGLFNAILKSLGLSPIGWLQDPATAVPSVILFKGWKDFGTAMLIYLDGLQDIGSEVKEAAMVDGANVWQRFIHITFPLLKPSHTYLLLTNIINVFMIFQETYVLEGALNSTRTVVNYIYEQGFQSFRMGYASAMSFVLFLFIIIVTIVQQRFSKMELA